jgi:lysophospholipase L1-like esterase
MDSKTPDVEKLDPNMSSESQIAEDGLQWISYKDPRLVVNGLNWYPDGDLVLRRLPARSENVVRESVWDLAQHPSGARIRFKSNAKKMTLKITQPRVTMVNMCPIGHSGIDVYAGPPDSMVYWKSTRPDLSAIDRGHPYDYPIFEDIAEEFHEFTLYLPVYNRLSDLQIGLDPGAQILPPTQYATGRPVVFYGTSITQSGCASRPGNGYVPILGRMLACDVVNLGFAGNGLGEPELADLVSEIDASVFVLDYEANAGLERMRENLLPFAETIRKKHLSEPIIIVSNPFWTNGHLIPDAYEAHKRAITFFRSVADKLNAKYPGPVISVDGWSLIGPETKYAYVDGVHPNDYGFAMMAEKLCPVLKSLLPPV